MNKLAALVLVCVCGGVSAQTMYKCGNSYQQAPCDAAGGGAIKLHGISASSNTSAELTGANITTLKAKLEVANTLARSCEFDMRVYRQDHSGDCARYTKAWSNVEPMAKKFAELLKTESHDMSNSDVREITRLLESVSKSAQTAAGLVR